MATHMTVAFAVIVATLMLAIAGYAQYRIPFHTAASRVALARGVLALIGVAFGYTMAANVGAGVPAPLVFVAGFGVVHVPAAIILLVKHLQGAGRS